MNEETKVSSDYKKVSTVITYDTLLNPKDADSSEWMRLTLPFSDQCCLKILDMTLIYPVNSNVDEISGFFSVKNSKNYSTNLNSRGQCEVVINNEIKKDPFIINVPLSMPGTRKPKALAALKLDISLNQEEIKFCVSNGKREPIKLQRAVFVFEIVRNEKVTTL